MDGVFVLSTLQNSHHTATTICVGPILRTSIYLRLFLSHVAHHHRSWEKRKKIKWERENEILHKESLTGDEEVVQSSAAPLRSRGMIRMARKTRTIWVHRGVAAYLMIALCGGFRSET